MKNFITYILTKLFFIVMSSMTFYRRE